VGNGAEEAIVQESENREPLKAPFPWFGGKSRAAALIWDRLGDCANYVEPFFGSGAVLLGRPTPQKIETVNDLDGFVANAWRAMRANPESVADWANNPVNENDLHARHSWLVSQREPLTRRLEGDAEFCDPKVAGWWLWGIACWIGSGFCSGKGPWVVEGGMLVKGDAGRGVKRQRPHLGSAGQGVNRQLPHLGDAGRGVNRKLPLEQWFAALSMRLARTRVCCGDWARVLGPTPTTKLGVTGVVLDPPYADTAGRCGDIYAKDSLSVANDVRRWAIENGDNPKLRIALCGYSGEHEMPDSWECVPWRAIGGYGARAGNENCAKERVWFSPACLKPTTEQGGLSLEVAQ
jgi:hypothetical protein